MKIYTKILGSLLFFCALLPMGCDPSNEYPAENEYEYPIVLELVALKAKLYYNDGNAYTTYSGADGTGAYFLLYDGRFCGGMALFKTPYSSDTFEVPDIRSQYCEVANFPDYFSSFSGELQERAMCEGIDVIVSGTVYEKGKPLTQDLCSFQFMFKIKSLKIDPISPSYPYPVN
jgi:hypothetical protein